MQDKSNQRKVSVRFYGGLGNQIFQYLFGKLLSSRNLAEVHFDANWLNMHSSHPGSDLRNFKFAEEIKYADEQGAFTIRYDELYTRLARSIKPISSIRKVNFGCSLDEVNSDLTKRYSRFCGYYQNLDYPISLIEELRNSDWSLTQYSESFTEIIANLQDKKFIALHVRGGDYLADGSIHKNLDAKYYQQSLYYVMREIPEATVLIFTDDKFHAQQILQENTKFLYVSDLKLTVSEEFVLMSKANAHIIANSTFSYWSAQLSKTSSIAICPRDWYKGTNEIAPSYPSKWVVI